MVRGEIDDYEDRHPDPQDVALVVEIATSSLAKDRKLAETYGGGGIRYYTGSSTWFSGSSKSMPLTNGAYPSSTILNERTISSI